jgi:AcrR family transcriptional regulator
MSKTGFTGATISRIARKSGVTSGSIYNFYPDKEALMNDAVNELMRTTQNQTLDAKRTASTKQQPNFGLTDSFHFGLSADRRIWLRFRQECIIATRHHKTTFKQMKKVVAELDQAMIDSFPKIDKQIIGLVSMGEQAIGYGFSSLFGYTNLLDKCDFDAIMVQVAKQNSL